MAKGGIGGKPIGGPVSIGGGPKGNTIDAPVTLGSVSAAGSVGTLALKSEPTVLLAALVAAGAVTAPTAAGSIFGSVTLGSLAAAGEVGVLGASSSPALLLAGVAAAGEVGALSAAIDQVARHGDSPVIVIVGAEGAPRDDRREATRAIRDLHRRAGVPPDQTATRVDASVTLGSVGANATIGRLAFEAEASNDDSYRARWGDYPAAPSARTRRGRSTAAARVLDTPAPAPLAKVDAPSAPSYCTVPHADQEGDPELMEIALMVAIERYYA